MIAGLHKITNVGYCAKRFKVGPSVLLHFIISQNLFILRLSPFTKIADSALVKNWRSKCTETVSAMTQPNVDFYRLTDASSPLL